MTLPAADNGNHQVMLVNSANPLPATLPAAVTFDFLDTSTPDAFLPEARDLSLTCGQNWPPRPPQTRSLLSDSPAATYNLPVCHSDVVEVDPVTHAVLVTIADAGCVVNIRQEGTVYVAKAFRDGETWQVRADDAYAAAVELAGQVSLELKDGRYRGQAMRKR